MYRPILAKTITAATLVITSAIAHGAPLQVVPAGASAFIHIDAAALAKSPNMAFVSKMARHVLPETSRFSRQRLGFDVTQLIDVTVVCPKMEASQHNFEGVIVATFSSGLEKQRFFSRLVSEFHLQAADEQTFVGNDLSICLASTDTVVLGTPATVAWWKEAHDRPGDSELSNTFNQSRGRSHILFGVRAGQVSVPMVAMAFIPATLINQSEVMTCGFTFGEMVAIEANWRYTTEENATQAIEALESLVMQAKSMLGPTEASLVATLSDENSATGDGFGALAGLALVRQGRAYLDDFKVERAGTAARATIEIDNELPTVIAICLGSIQAVGNQAEVAFEEIAAELE